MIIPIKYMFHTITSNLSNIAILPTKNILNIYLNRGIQRFQIRCIIICYTYIVQSAI